MKRSILIIVSLVLAAIVIGVYCKMMLLDRNLEDRMEVYIKGVTDEDIIVSEDTATVYVDSQILVNLREERSKKELEKL